MKYSEAWREPVRENCALLALDKKYEWMLPIACRALRKHIHARFDIEVWTWGTNIFDYRVTRHLDATDARVLTLPSTNQYCEGWEARHHAMCITAYRQIFMIDADTYVNAALPIFRQFDEDMHLNVGTDNENYRLPEFRTFFKLPESLGGYQNYSVWFGEYDRSKDACKRVLQYTSDLLGTGPSSYEAARVIGDQDLRNGYIHQLGATIKKMNVKVNAWVPLDQQIRSNLDVLHQGHKIHNEKECLSLIERLGI